jgi:hypothetical protein
MQPREGEQPARDADQRNGGSLRGGAHRRAANRGERLDEVDREERGADRADRENALRGAVPNRKTCRRKNVAENSAQRCKTTTVLSAGSGRSPTNKTPREFHETERGAERTPAIWYSDQSAQGLMEEKGSLPMSASENGSSRERSRNLFWISFFTHRFR